MSRDLPSTIVTEIAKPVVNLVLLAEFDFAAGPVRFWTGLSNLSWGGYTWAGSGSLGTVTPIDEIIETSAAGLTFTLSGIPSNLATLALEDAYRGRRCRLWLAIVNTTPAVVDAYQIFGGRMDTLKISDAGQTSSISVQAENALIDLQRARNLRYTHEEQQRLFPGDLGLAYVATLADALIYWGVNPPAIAAVPGYPNATPAVSKIF
jgi:hypothetical protein